VFSKGKIDPWEQLVRFDVTFQVASQAECACENRLKLRATFAIFTTFTRLEERYHHNTLSANFQVSSYQVLLSTQSGEFLAKR
jgi:hypothetical protein